MGVGVLATCPRASKRTVPTALDESNVFTRTGASQILEIEGYTVAGIALHGPDQRRPVIIRHCSGLAIRALSLGPEGLLIPLALEHPKQVITRLQGYFDTLGKSRIHGSRAVFEFVFEAVVKGLRGHSHRLMLSGNRSSVRTHESDSIGENRRHTSVAVLLRADASLFVPKATPAFIHQVFQFAIDHIQTAQPLHG